MSLSNCSKTRMVAQKSLPNQLRCHQRYTQQNFLQHAFGEIQSEGKSQFEQCLMEFSVGLWSSHHWPANNHKMCLRSHPKPWCSRHLRSHSLRDRLTSHLSREHSTPVEKAQASEVELDPLGGSTNPQASQQ